MRSAIPAMVSSSASHSVRTSSATASSLRPGSARRSGAARASEASISVRCPLSSARYAATTRIGARRPRPPPSSSSVAASAQCRSSSTTATGRSAVTSASHFQVAWRRRNRPAVASAFTGPVSVSSGARSSANSPGAVVAATALSASVQAHAGGALSTSRQRPAATSHPSRSSRLPRCSSSVDLPSPASPVTRATRAPSVTAWAAAVTSADSCASRPTNGVSPIGAGSGGGAVRGGGAVSGGVGACGVRGTNARRTSVRWVRIASSNAVRSGPGSSPSSSARTPRARRSVASASAWRPLLHSARACSRQPSSRSGSPRVSRSASGTIAAGSPMRRPAATCSSVAVSRSSFSRAVSAAAHGSSATSANAGPRHNPSASASRAFAVRGSVSVRARSSSSSNRHASTDSGGSRSAYPGAALTSNRAGVRGGRPGSSSRRRLETYACKDISARAGGSPRHRSSIIRSTGTTCPRAATSSASTPRCRGPPRWTDSPFTSVANAPSTRTKTMIRTSYGDVPSRLQVPSKPPGAV